MTNIQLFKLAIHSANESLWPILQRNWLTLLAVFIFVQLHVQYFLFLMQLPLLDESTRMLCQLGVSASGLIESVFLVMLIPLRYNNLLNNEANQPFWPFFKKYIGPLTLEGIKMTALVILWTLLFIIPGVVKQVRWYFMPFVVMFNPEYERGHLNPLDQSNKLVKGSSWLIFLFGLAVFIASMLIQKTGSIEGFSPLPLQVACSSAVNMILSVYTYLVFYKIYLEKNKTHLKEVIHEPSI